MKIRDASLEDKRRFAWLFSSDKLAVCVDAGAEFDLQDDGDVVLSVRGLDFKLRSRADIAIFAAQIPLIDVVVPQKFADTHEKWAFVSLDTKNNVGLSSRVAASRENVEIIPDGTNVRETSEKCDLPIFAAFSLSGVENPLELVGEIEELKNISGVSIVNDAPAHEKELPQKVIERVEAMGFKGFANYRVFVGYR